MNHNIPCPLHSDYLEIRAAWPRIYFKHKKRFTERPPKLGEANNNIYNIKTWRRRDDELASKAMAHKHTPGLLVPEDRVVGRRRRGGAGVDRGLRLVHVLAGIKTRT